MNPARVVVGISGGVDSAVTALLLKQAGHDVHGLFMRNWDKNDPQCRANDDRKDAMAVCAKLGIPLAVRDFSKEYRNKVFARFLDDSRAGLTPNPDILCNSEIKFDCLAGHAESLDAQYIATGHYARRDTVNGSHRLLRGLDANKDQSYFLHALNQTQLAHALFPLGELEKTEVRQLAEQHELRVAGKKDSTGICFIGERDFRQFLAEHLPLKHGDIVTTGGQKVGKHQGVAFYTLGQRGGLGIGGVKNHPDAPWYVVHKDEQRNLLVVDQDIQSPFMMSHSLTANEAHAIAGQFPAKQFRCHAQIRYRQAGQPCEVTVLDAQQVSVRFDEPQRAVTPGQSVVFYDDDHICLGGAVIRSHDAPTPQPF